MVDVATLAVNSVIISALYALVAIGFTLIFGVGGVLNLSHGATITLGAFAAYYASGGIVEAGVGGAVLAAIVVPALFSAAVYKGLIERIQDQPVMVMILTLVVAIAVEQVFLVAEGTQPKSIPSLLDGTVALGGSKFQTNLLVVFALSWVIIAGLFYTINNTETGKAILATSMTTKGAALVGIESDRVNLYTWVVAGGLAGVAGLFLGSFQTANFAMGRGPLMLSFAIVVIGGIGSVKGSLVGAYVIGTAEVVTGAINTRLTGLVPLLLLILVLLVKPEGLFGRELAE
ncbi:branched-chain amino acid ABC transporter permease [Haloarchaeobius sp. FL176]|uniref:branched-chain amino acid ABC transporter permease n=1 Tax=Haloarchaeobius sp. FL176 TaxID=2967129 RepID=UPI002148EB50|nr:branched-chain amino acid ABC transporter permease [Haloarchaeobius sp. FL176]